MKTHRFTKCTALPLLALVTLAAPARAASPADQAAAEVLFNEAKKLVAASDFEHACPKFVESQRLDPTVGTLLNIGDCYEKWGKLASAWGAFKDAEMRGREVGDTARQAEATRRADALTPKLSKLAIVVPPAARVPGLEVKRDGATVGEGQWGSPIPIDVGHHTIEATAPGRKRWSADMRIEVDAAAASIEVQPLEVLPTNELPGGGGARTFFWTPRRTAAVAVGGVGVASAIVGAVAGGLALGKAASAGSHCQPMGDATACDPTGLALRHDGRTLANVSNVALAVAGATIVTSVVLFATSPAGDDVKPPSAATVRAGVAFNGATTGFSIEGMW